MILQLGIPFYKYHRAIYMGNTYALARQIGRNNVENLTLSKPKKPFIFAQSKKGPDRNPARFIQYPRPFRNPESLAGLINNSANLIPCRWFDR
jgi:hypothetical protein